MVVPLGASLAFIAPALPAKSSARAHSNETRYDLPFSASPFTSSSLRSSRVVATCSGTEPGIFSKESDTDCTDSRNQSAPMQVRQVLSYPIKGARVDPRQSAVVSGEGLVGDRRFMVVSSKGSHVTQREYPLLATLEARTVEDGRALMLRAGSRALNVTVQRSGPLVSCTLFGERIGLWDQGASVSKWLGELLLPGGGAANPVASLLPPPFATPAFRLMHAPPEVPRHAGLSDASPLHLLCEESLNALNARRGAEGRAPVPMDRFRPNLVVAGCGQPHAEDAWRSVRIGDRAFFRVSGPCPRCTVPDVSQQHGRRDPAESGPMQSLRGYRTRAGRGIAFGIYLEPLTTGVTVHVGDRVEPMLGPSDLA